MTDKIIKLSGEDFDVVEAGHASQKELRIIPKKLKYKSLNFDSSKILFDPNPNIEGDEVLYDRIRSIELSPIVKNEPVEEMPEFETINFTGKHHTLDLFAVKVKNFNYVGFPGEKNYGFGTFLRRGCHFGAVEIDNFDANGNNVWIGVYQYNHVKNIRGNVTFLFDPEEKTDLSTLIIGDPNASTMNTNWTGEISAFMIPFITLDKETFPHSRSHIAIYNTKVRAENAITTEGTLELTNCEVEAPIKAKRLISKTTTHSAPVTVVSPNGYSQLKTGFSTFNAPVSVINGDVTTIFSTFNDKVDFNLNGQLHSTIESATFDGPVKMSVNKEEKTNVVRIENTNFDRGLKLGPRVRVTSNDGYMIEGVSSTLGQMLQSGGTVAGSLISR